MNYKKLEWMQLLIILKKTSLKKNKVDEFSRNNLKINNILEDIYKVSPIFYDKYLEEMVKKQKKIVLDEYEKEILEAYENGMLKPSKSQPDYQTIARNTMKKNRKINIRISENDLSALQRRAAREGIPYQTLIGSVLHKYASGFLKDAT